MEHAQRPGESNEDYIRRLGRMIAEAQSAGRQQVPDDGHERNHGAFVEAAGAPPPYSDVNNYVQNNNFHNLWRDNNEITFFNVCTLVPRIVLILYVYCILATPNFSAQKEIEMASTKPSNTNSTTSQLYTLFQYEQHLHNLEFSVQDQLWRYNTMHPSKPSEFSAPLENSLNRLNETKVKTHILVQGLNTSMTTSNRYIAHCLAAVRVKLHPCQIYSSWFPAWAIPRKMLPDVKAECQNTINVIYPLLTGYRGMVDSLKDSTILVRTAMMGHNDSYPLSKRDEVIFANITSELGILDSKLTTQIYYADTVSVSLADLDITDLPSLRSIPCLSQLLPDKFVPQHPYKPLEKQVQAWKEEHDIYSYGWDTQVVKVQKKEL